MRKMFKIKWLESQTILLKFLCYILDVKGHLKPSLKKAGP